MSCRKQNLCELQGYREINENWHLKGWARGSVTEAWDSMSEAWVESSAQQKRKRKGRKIKKRYRFGNTGKVNVERKS